VEIANGLHRIGSDLVNSYLVVDGGGITIIDAGLPGYWKLLDAELAAMGKTVDDVRALVLTHGDTDHIGFAARLYGEKGIAAYIHEADVDRARLKVKKPTFGSWGRSRSGRLPAFCGIQPVTAGYGSAQPPNCRPSPTVTCSTCLIPRGSSTHPGTRPAA
jgi:glyoxylase-like metal-dependent hydrolase (beta-lactamase superfamily II)